MYTVKNTRTHTIDSRTFDSAGEMVLPIESVSDDQIRALRTESAAAGDLEMAETCRRALRVGERGSNKARRTAEQAIRAASAMVMVSE